MLMTNFLKDRKSIREFRNKNIETEKIKTIKAYIKSSEEDNGSFKFRLYENGDYIYEQLKGIGGYSGLMIESPHYITLEEIKEGRNALIYGAYHMERLITKLNLLGIETCWVSLDTVKDEFKEKLFGEHTGNIDYMIAIGYGKRKNPFAKEITSSRLGVDEIVYSEKIGEQIEDQELEHRGLGDLFYYVRFAPSKWNSQPWRFLLEKDKVTLLIKYKDDYGQHLVEAGIIMYYFKELAKAIRIENEWELLEGSQVEEDSTYEYIAQLKL